VDRLEEAYSLPRGVYLVIATGFVCVGRDARTKRVAEKELLHKRTSVMASALGSSLPRLLRAESLDLNQAPVFYHVHDLVTICLMQTFMLPCRNDAMSILRPLKSFLLRDVLNTKVHFKCSALVKITTQASNCSDILQWPSVYPKVHVEYALCGASTRIFLVQRISSSPMVEKQRICSRPLCQANNASITPIIARESAPSGMIITSRSTSLFAVSASFTNLLSSV
jgi:hypothetical protein